MQIFLKIAFKLFKLIIEWTWYCVTICVGIVGTFLNVYRLPWIEDIGGDWVGWCWTQLGVGLLGLIVYPVYFAAFTFVWHWPRLAKRASKLPYPWKIMDAAYVSFFVGLLDLVLAPLALTVLCTGIRTRKLIDKYHNVDEFEKRWQTVVQFVFLLADLLYLPVACIVLLTWRSRPMLRVLTDSTLTSRDKQAKTFKYFFLVLYDLPFIVLGLVVVASLWRLPALVAAIRKCEDSEDLRAALLKHFLLLFRDIVSFVCSGILLGTLYRALSFVLKFFTLRQNPLDTPPVLAVSHLSIDYIEGGGMRVRLRGFKTPGLPADPNATCAGKLYLQGSFWDRVESTFGSTAKSVGQAMLPLSLKSEVNYNVTDVTGPGPFDTTLNLAVGMKQVKAKNVRNALNKLGSSSVITIQIEYGNQTGVMLRVRLRTADVVSAMDGEIALGPGGFIGLPKGDVPKPLYLSDAYNFSCKCCFLEEDEISVNAVAPTERRVSEKAGTVDSRVNDNGGGSGGGGNGGDSDDGDDNESEAIALPYVSFGGMDAASTGTAAGPDTETAPNAEKNTAGSGAGSESGADVDDGAGGEGAGDGEGSAGAGTDGSEAGPAIELAPLTSIKEGPRIPVSGDENVKTTVKETSSLDANGSGVDGMVDAERVSKPTGDTLCAFGDESWVAFPEEPETNSAPCSKSAIAPDVVAAYRGFQCPLEVDQGQKHDFCWCDALWAASLEHMIYLLKDLFCLVAILRLIALSPWRVPTTFVRLLESDEYARARQLQYWQRQFMHAHVIIWDSERMSYDEMYHSLLKKQTTFTATPDTVDIGSPETRRTTRLRKRREKAIAELKKVGDEEMNKTLDALEKARMGIEPAIRETVKLQLSSGDSWAPCEDVTASREQQENLLNSYNQCCRDVGAVLVDKPSFWKTCSIHHRSWAPILLKEVSEATKNTFAALAALFVVATLYRAPFFVRDIVKTPLDRAGICFEYVKEICLDFFIFLKALVVLVLIRHSFSLLGRAAAATFELDFARIPDEVDDLFDSAVEDVLYLLSLITAWRSYKFLLATACWGVLTPADHVYAALSFVGSNALRVLASSVLWLVYLVFPFVFVFVMMENSDADDLPGLKDYLAIYVGGLFAYIGMAVLYFRTARKETMHQVESLTRPVYEVRWNWANAFAAIILFAETYQFVSMPLSLREVPQSATQPAFLFLTNDDIWKAGFWIAVGAVCVWFFIAALPPVVEEMLEWRRKGHFENVSLYRAVRSAFGPMLLLTVVTTLLDKAHCTVADVSSGPHCPSDVFGDKDVAIVALLSLAFYIPTVTVASIQDALSAKSSDNLDVIWYSVLSVGVLVVKLGNVAVRTFVQDDADVATYLFLCLGVLMYLALVKLPTLTLCSSRFFSFLRRGLALGVVWANVATLCLGDNASSSEWKVWVWSGLIACVLVHYVLFRVSEYRAVKAVASSHRDPITRAHMQTLCGSLHTAVSALPPGVFVPWMRRGVRRRMLSLMKRSTRPPHPLATDCHAYHNLRLALSLLEAGVHGGRLDRSYISSGGLEKWRSRTSRATTLSDLKNAMLQLLDAIQFVKGETMQASIFKESVEKLRLVNIPHASHRDVDDIEEGEFVANPSPVEIDLRRSRSFGALSSSS